MATKRRKSSQSKDEGRVMSAVSRLARNQGVKLTPGQLWQAFEPVRQAKRERKKQK
jgi:hypothetical protein